MSQTLFIYDDDQTSPMDVSGIVCYPTNSGVFLKISHEGGHERTMYLTNTIRWSTLAPVEIRGDLL